MYLKPVISASIISVIVRAIPVILVVVLSTPAWLTWPFLPEARQRYVLEMVDALARWMRGDSRDAEPHERKPELEQ